MPLLTFIGKANIITTRETTKGLIEISYYSEYYKGSLDIERLIVFQPFFFSLGGVINMLAIKILPYD